MKKFVKIDYFWKIRKKFENFHDDGHDDGTMSMETTPEGEARWGTMVEWAKWQANGGKFEKKDYKRGSGIEAVARGDLARKKY